MLNFTSTIENHCYLVSLSGCCAAYAALKKFSKAVLPLPHTKTLSDKRMALLFCNLCTRASIRYIRSFISLSLFIVKVTTVCGLN